MCVYMCVCVCACVYVTISNSACELEDLVCSYLHNSFLHTHKCQPLLLTFTQTRHACMSNWYVFSCSVLNGRVPAKDLNG